ncbi:IS1380-Spn1 transposase [Streptococcus pneumoniae]|nr:IS1380-Spn1 transposase [Streptococcus pneumoniae]
MNSLPNHHFQNKSFYQLSFDGGHLTQYGGLIFFQELFSHLFRCKAIIFISCHLLPPRYQNKGVASPSICLNTHPNDGQAQGHLNLLPFQLLQLGFYRR